MRSLLNKKQCHVTPSSEELSRRRENFVNDAVMTDRMRTKFRDIIPPYRAEDDEHCRTYFRRKDVQKLLKITLSPRFWINQPRSPTFSFIIRIITYFQKDVLVK